MAVEKHLQGPNQADAAERTTALPTSPEPGPFSVEGQSPRLSHAQRLFRNPILGRLLPLGTLALAVASIASPANNSTHPLLSLATGALEPTRAEAAESTVVQDTGVGGNYTETVTDSQGNKITLSTKNGTNGEPPNNPNHGVDTNYISKNGSSSKSYQVREALFSSDTWQVAVAGHRINLAANKTYIIGETLRNSTGGGRGFPYIAVIDGIENIITGQTQQTLVAGIPQGGTFLEGLSYFREDVDALKFDIKNSVNKEEDGDYEAKIDSSGMPGVAKKIANALKSIFLPSVSNKFSG